MIRHTAAAGDHDDADDKRAVSVGAKGGLIVGDDGMGGATEHQHMVLLCYNCGKGLSQREESHHMIPRFVCTKRNEQEQNRLRHWLLGSLFVHASLSLELLNLLNHFVVLLNSLISMVIQLRHT